MIAPVGVERIICGSKKTCKHVANKTFLSHNPAMNKSTAIALAGGVRELAEILDITTQSVYCWKDDKIPRRSLQLLRHRKAAWFRNPSTNKKEEK